MFSKHNLFLTLAFAFFAPVIQAGPIVYAVDGFAQFGTIELPTGTFHQTGTYGVPGGGGLSVGPNGNLFSLAFSGDLYSVNPQNGAASFIVRQGWGVVRSQPTLAAPLRRTLSSFMRGRSTQPTSLTIFMS